MVIAALLAVMLLPGCGHASAPKDPFVGTWHDFNPPPGVTAPPVVIVKVADGYTAVLPVTSPGGGDAPFSLTLASLTGQGDKLVGTSDPGLGSPVRVEIAYLPESGHLTYSEAKRVGGPMGKPQEMIKVSDSTAFPSPLLSASPR